jgi:hypothetical protein
VKTYFCPKEFPEDRGQSPTIFGGKYYEKTKERKADRSFNSTGEEEHQYV